MSDFRRPAAPRVERSRPSRSDSIYPDGLFVRAAEYAPQPSAVTGEPSSSFSESIFQGTDDLSAVGSVGFEVTIYGERELPDYASFDFSYTHEDAPIALLRCRPVFMPRNTFTIMHREVAPHLRRQGIGEQLYARVEEFFTGLASQSGDTMHLQMRLAQPDVMKWARDLGFDVQDDEDRAQVDEILAHPDRYHIAPRPDVPVEQRRNDYVYRNGDQNGEPLRFLFEKDIAPE